MNAELEQIKTARSSLQKFRAKLLRPSAASLESGSSDLVVAVECLKQLEAVLSGQGRRTPGQAQMLQWELSSLRSELQQVNALLECASQFFKGWSRLLSPAEDDAACNYTATGKMSPQISSDPNRVVMHG